MAAGQRQTFLAEQCGEDSALQREVVSLLDAHFEDSQFLETPPFDAATAPGRRDTVYRPGDKIGPYEVREPLGAGGMGDVLLARQESEDFSRSVAIKLVRRGMDTEEVLRRFSLERRILASLSHPNIAQLYDAGATDDGRPYFAMEYVDGERLDDWTRNRQPSTAERLDLFRAVCDAVQYAHQNLVLHRDIKPGNVLVSKDGIPKLVDFGIGKIIADDPSGSLTQTQHAVLTPDYAAPEQRDGGPVTTATDIYALGALLYELVTGERATLASRAQHGGELAHELLSIARQAMREDPDRRYPTAAALSDDIDRYRKGLPVSARGDSPIYRAGKFVRRNAWMVATGIVLAVGMAGITATTMVQSARVERERDKAQEVQRFLLETFGASTAEGATGDSISVRQLLDGQAAILDTAYKDDPELRAEMMFVIGDAYERLGLYEDAARFASRALDERRRLYADEHPDIAGSLNLLGWIRHRQGSSDSAIELLEESVAMWRAIGGDHPAATARALNDLGSVYDQVGRSTDAEQLLRESLAMRTRGGDSRGPGVAVTSSNLAVLLYRRGDYAGAEEFGRAALDALRESVGPDHQRSFVAQSNLATFLWVAGDLEGADVLLEDLLGRQTRLDGGRNARAAGSMVTYASLLRLRGRIGEAESLLRDALAIQEEVLDPNHRSIGNTTRVLGVLLQQTGRVAEAIPILERSLAVNRSAYGDNHLQVANALLALAIAHEENGELELARQGFLDSVATFEQAVGPDHANTKDARDRLERLTATLNGPL